MAWADESGRLRSVYGVSERERAIPWLTDKTPHGLLNTRTRTQILTDFHRLYALFHLCLSVKSVSKRFVSQSGAIPDYSGTEGFVRLIFLRALKNGEGHFTLITFWENIEAIKKFAGDEYEKAKYYPEDDGYLLEFEARVVHYKVFAEA